jgi:hypothetical protein
MSKPMQKTTASDGATAENVSAVAGVEATTTESQSTATTPNKTSVAVKEKTMTPDEATRVTADFLVTYEGVRGNPVTTMKEKWPATMTTDDIENAIEDKIMDGTFDQPPCGCRFGRFVNVRKIVAYVKLTKRQAEIVYEILSQWNGDFPARQDTKGTTLALLDDDGAHGFASHLQDEAETVMHYCEEDERQQAAAYARVCENVARKIWSAIDPKS